MSTKIEQQRQGCLIAGDKTLPLTKIEIDGTIRGLLHQVKIRQSFVNDHDVPLEAVYIHPLPPRASVHGFQLRIGDRVVEGEVKERAQARAAYAKALQDGHRAALMEEDRSDVFTTSVGNIAPGEIVVIAFELSGPLEFLESTASLHIPMVVPEVFIPGLPLGGPDVGDGIAMDTDIVPDASRMTPPRLDGAARNPVDLRLSFVIDPSGLEIEEVDSLCHFAKVGKCEDGTFVLSLLPGLERLDRDFVIRLRLKEGHLQTTLVTDQGTDAFALTVVPPLGLAGMSQQSRGLVIALDRSGSMSGESMVLARRAAASIVESLTPADQFGIVAFDDIMELLDTELLPADMKNKERARDFLSSIDARGGTMAFPALQQAVSMLSPEWTADKSVLFITDGDVGNDSQMLAASAGKIRVHTVGIGVNSRSGVLQGMAKASGGLFCAIPDLSTLEEAFRNLHQRLGKPHWTGLNLRGQSVSEASPHVWDVWEGVPVTFFGKASDLSAQVVVEGRLANRHLLTTEVSVVRRDDPAVYRAWARSRLLDLDDLWTLGKADEHDLVSLSIDAQVLCRFTAFSAVDKSEVVENAARRTSVVQPVEPTLHYVEPTVNDVSAQDFGSFGDDMDEEIALDKLKEMIDEAPIVRVVNLILSQAINDGATEFRIDPTHNSLEVYFKIEDEWQHIMSPPKHIQVPVLERFRVLAEDNQFVINFHSLYFQIQVSFVSTENGEGLVAQISDVKSKLLEQLEHFEQADEGHKAFILEEIVTEFGTLCRVGQIDEAYARVVVDHLVDLQHAVKIEENVDKTLATVRSVLASLQLN